MKELYREHWRLNIEFKFLFWKYTRSYKYRTATLGELIEFSQSIKNEDDILDWLFDFLNNNGQISKRELKQLDTKKINSLLEYLMKTFGKKFFEGEKGKGGREKAPISSFFALLMSNSGESIETLLKLTWEQILFLSDGVIWNLNEQTKEGKKRNKIELQKKQFKEEVSDDEALRMVREMESKFDKTENKI